MARVGGYDLNLRALRAPAPGAMYDARSLTWQSAGRWWSMFGGQAALMLQVTDPRVAAGVVQHSNWERDPFGRLIRTMQAMLSISFGSAEVSARSAEQLWQWHVTIAGSTAGGAAYAGTDTDTEIKVDYIEVFAPPVANPIHLFVSFGVTLRTPIFNIHSITSLLWVDTVGNAHALRSLHG